MADISIIITTFNDKLYLQKTIDSILNRNPIEQSVELIVVDNGSTDGTIEWANGRNDFTFLREIEHLNSPYSCRNRGIESASGNVIILLDSTCVPSEGWLEKGLSCLQREGADVVGGDVIFDFEGKVTASKIYDSLTNVKMKESIEVKGVAKSGNLFINRKVIDKIGLFPEGIRSGADVRWTYKVTNNGMKLIFSPDATVYKAAKEFTDLIVKQWRVGKHQPMIWKDMNKKIDVGSCLKKLFIPVSPLGIKRLLAEKGTPEIQGYFIRVWFVAQVVKMTMALANIKGILSLKREK